ncbi:hypothetical protein FHETE_7563 [Fusarium heterosporum]|uniref:Uncharacterized protein n=1 Tax=Fusarium heterosporum TaxID=42747 RepID=A0A8H5WM60_FUSHE|nr:hypothetical protein FHETE_7563 [Fusarium heterosporum]
MSTKVETSDKDVIVLASPEPPTVPVAPPALAPVPGQPVLPVPPVPLTNPFAPTQVRIQDPFFTYKKECRLAWIRYLGLLNKVKLRDGPDGLPFFIGMPPEYSTSSISPFGLEMIQREALNNPRNSLICLETVLATLRDRPLHTHIGISIFIEDRDHLKYWEAAGSRHPFVLLNSSKPPQAFLGVHKAIIPAMNRLVGIHASEQDPASLPGYVPAMASFEKALWKSEKANNDAQRRQCADIALRLLRKFMDSHQNEAIIERMTEYHRHYEALVTIAKQERVARNGK